MAFAPIPFRGLASTHVCEMGSTAMDEGKVNAVGFRKVRSMADRKEQLEVLSERLAEYVPTIPDELTEHCMAEGGLVTRDKRLVRLVSVAAQRFVALATNDALQVCKRRKLASAKELRERGFDPRDKKLALTMEDLAVALEDYGVNLKTPQYFTDANANAEETGARTGRQ
eukprot:scaffold1499_cov318-Pavlova_lutheri.AAC.6